VRSAGAGSRRIQKNSDAISLTTSPERLRSQHKGDTLRELAASWLELLRDLKARGV